MQPRRQVRAVHAPGKDVEARRLLAHEEIVGPVVPHQVIRAHPREHIGEIAGGKNALGGGASPPQAQHALGLECTDRRLGVEVEQHHAERGGVHSLVAPLRHHGQHQGSQDATRAHAQRVELVAAADLADHVDPVEQSLDIVVDAPVALLRAGIAPTGDEHRHAARDGVLHEAALRRQVHEVVLADRRHDQQSRSLGHLRRGRLVLENLNHLVAKHNGPGRGGQVLTQAKCRLVGLPGHALVVQETVDHVHRAVSQAHATGLEGALERRWVAQQGVGGSKRAGQYAAEEPRTLAFSPVGSVVGEPIDGLAERHIAQPQPTVQRMLTPGWVGKARVLDRQLFVAETKHATHPAAIKLRGLAGQQLGSPRQTGCPLEQRRRGAARFACSLEWSLVRNRLLNGQ